MNAELTEASLCILALEAKRQSLKKKVKHFLLKLEEERICWKSRAQQKNCAVDELKQELGRERKSRQHIENLNTNLINQLEGAKFSAEHFMNKYEEEQKSRKLMQEISNELAEQIGEYKAEVGALKRESKNIIAEVGEERNVLQMAEVWPEERVQMKLSDTKLALEDKYCQLNQKDNGFNQTHLLKQLNCHNDYNSCLQKDARGSCDSLEGGNPAIDRVGQGKTLSRGFSDSNDNAVQSSPDREISEVCAASEKQSKCKTSSASKLWGSFPSNGDRFR